MTDIQNDENATELDPMDDQVIQEQNDDDAPMAADDAAEAGNTISLFDRIRELKLEQKLINIALAEMKVQQGLADDAAQDIRIAWSKAKVKPEFSPGETASYAHRIARHCALRTRRELGSPVRLPGSAFRKRKDGTTYVTPGILSDPLDWDEMADRLSTEDGEQAQEKHMINQDRIRELGPILSEQQLELVTYLAQGYDLSEAADAMGVRVSTLQRQINAIHAVLQANGMSQIS